jgi:hypothetical protein
MCIENPTFERRLAAHATAAVSTKNEKFSHIEVRRIVRGRRSSRDQRKTSKPSVTSNEKWKPAVRFRPIELKLLVV